MVDENLKMEKIRSLDLGTENQTEKIEIKKEKRINWKLLAGAMAVVLFGVLTGFGLSSLNKKGTSSGSVIIGGNQLPSGADDVKVGAVYGSDSELFQDTVIGVIEANDQGGEGTHLLLREGGESQTAYLTSSVVDLDMFVGRKVEILGETFDAQKVGWLLDVGRVKVLE